MFWIHFTLTLISFFTFVLGLYSAFNLKKKEIISNDFLQHIKSLLLEKKYAAAMVSCKEASLYCAHVLASGLTARPHGYLVLIESMQRQSRQFATKWEENLSLLHEISILAPLFGLAGTAWGFFYLSLEGAAFSSALIGLGVGIMARLFYLLTSFQLARLLSVLDQATLPLGKYL